MNNHPTNYSGDLAVARVVAHLVKNRWYVLSGIVSEHMPFDLVAYKQKGDTCKFIRIQVKSSPQFKRTGPKGRIRYTENTIDFFATYLPTVDACIFVPVSMVPLGIKIKVRDELPDSATPFWWYADFLSFSTELRPKRTVSEFGKRIRIKQKSEVVTAKYPPLDALQLLVWKYPRTRLAAELGCSDTAIKKFGNRKGIVFPPQGYFKMSGSERLKVRTMFRETVQTRLREFSL